MIFLGNIWVVWWNSYQNLNQVSVGFSGAICGYLGFWLTALLIKTRNTYLEHAARKKVVCNLLFVLAISLLPNISFLAHFGGLAAGSALFCAFHLNKWIKILAIGTFIT